MNENTEGVLLIQKISVPDVAQFSVKLDATTLNQAQNGGNVPELRPKMPFCN